VTVRDLGAVRCGIVTFTVDGVEAGELKERLARERINVTVSPRSSTLLDSSARALPDLVRASVHYYNTDEELDRLVETVSNAAPRRAAGLAG
jgi:cysteine desulfurase/selenocysteine lyase